MTYLKDTFKRISDSASLMNEMHDKFLDAKAKKNWQKVRWTIILGTMTLMATPWAFGEMIDSVIQDQPAWAVAMFAAVSGLIIARVLVSLMNGISYERNFQSIYRDVDAKIARAFSNKNIKQLRTNKVLAASNINKARGYISEMMIDVRVGIERALIDLAFAYAATVVGSLAFGIPEIAIMSTIGLILAVAFSAYLNTQVMKITVPIEKRFRGYNRSYEESIQKFSDFKAQGMHEKLVFEQEREYEDIFKDDQKFWFWYIKHSELRQFIVTVFIVLSAYAFGLLEITKNPNSLPLVIALFSWGAIQVAALRELGRYERSFNRRLPSVKSLFEAIELAPIREENGRIRFSKDCKFDIVFENVSHSYESGNLVLSDINLEICAGEKWAFVGESGSGKTTLINLILGSMPPTEGHIYLRLEDGREIDLWDLDLDWWRSEVLGYVPQDVVLKDGTIRENLHLAIPKSSEIPDDAYLMETLERFGAIFRAEEDNTPFLDIQVGRDGGVELSGGQRQRMGIARAALKKAPFVIFDEATSSLDAKMTNSITQAFKKVLGPDKTSIMIAHNLATVAGGSPKRLLLGGDDSQVVCNHYLVIKPVSETDSGSPQIDYVGDWNGLHESVVMKELIEASQKDKILS